MTTTPYVWAFQEVITADELNTHTDAINELQDSVPLMLAGQVIITGTTSETFFSGGATYYLGSQVISFPSGYFTSAPTVTVKANSANPGPPISPNTGPVEVAVAGVSATGATIYMARNDNTVATFVYWCAVARTQ